MFVNSVSLNQKFVSNSTGKKVNNRQQHTSDAVSFSGGPRPEILKNQLKILLTQDIWAPSLRVKMPETAEEKEVLLEILTNRQKLDRFTRLSNEKAALKTKIAVFEMLAKKDPSSPELTELAKDLEKRGNLSSVLQTIDKNIQLEIKKNRPAYDYFKNLEKIEEEYLDKRLIKPERMFKFWQRIKKENINPDGKYSTKELIEIISKGADPSVAAAAIKQTPLSKKQLIGKVAEYYEEFLRENVDVYEGHFHHYEDAQRAKKSVEELFKAEIKKHPEVKRQFPKIYETIQNKFIHKVNRLADVDIYPIGEIWKDMKVVEADLRTAMSQAAKLKEQLLKNPDNAELKKLLAEKENAINEMKADWFNGVVHSLKFERMNRQRMIEADRIAEYDYLTKANKTLNRHKLALQLYADNGNKIPDDKWADLLG